MTTDVAVNQPATTEQSLNSKLAKSLLATGGDIKLVREKVNRNLPAGHQPVTEAEILDAFISETTSSTDMVDSIKALMLLNFLQILTELRGQLSSAMPDFSSADLIRTIQMMISGIAQLLPPPTVTQQAPQVNLLQQFGADGVRERVIGRLETYAQLEGKYAEGNSTPQGSE